MDIFFALLTTIFFLIAVVIANNMIATISNITRSTMASKRNALFLATFFASLGFILSGRKVMSTVSHKLFPFEPTTFLLATIITSLLMFIGTFFEISVSVQQVFLFSLLGIYYSLEIPFHFEYLLKVFSLWLLNVVFVAAIVLFIYKVLGKIINKICLTDRAWFMKILSLASSCILAYGLGANTIGTLTSSLGKYAFSNLTVLGVIIVMWYGAYILGNINRGKSRFREGFDFYSITCAQLGCGISLLIFTLAGIPLSIIYAMISSLLTIAFLKRIPILEKSIQKWVVKSTIVIPFIAFVLGASLSLLLLNI